MNQKPLVTYHGDKRLFSSLSSFIHQNLPEESIEWTRSYNRTVKNVSVEAKFVPFSDEVLLEEDSKSVINHALFHTYWTECYDLDAYKASVKEDISTWITKLKARNIHDWLIISVENGDGKKGNKAKLLPRTTVLDKIKNDFGSKQSEKCISLLDPFKSDSRAAESWSTLLNRIRGLVLKAYNKVLYKYEEIMRAQRNSRNETNWNFSDYFWLQEELAYVYETLGLYEDALVQYDEMDAVFSVCVQESKLKADKSDWLIPLCKPCLLWSSLSLSPSERVLDYTARDNLKTGNVTFLEFRNYLFRHQCALLLMLSRPWEVAQRALPFMHNCVNELSNLEIELPEGSVACWVFLTCMEILQSCERFNDSAHIEAYSLYTADLWAYARNKLHELGILCGLMPDLNESSEQLHLVVGLVAGMGSDPTESDIVVQSPRAKLKEALSSRSVFQKYYLEMSELAMGTFKHIGRIRSARLVGIELAHFYMKLNEPLKASVFFSDALKTYQEEKWTSLAVRTQLELVSAYEKTQETTKYIKTCSQLATSPFTFPGLKNENKIDYFHKMIETAVKIESDQPILMKIDNIFNVGDITIEHEGDCIISGDDIDAKFQIISLFLEEIHDVSIQISLKYNKSLEEMNSEKKKLNKRDSWGFFPSTYKAGVVENIKNCLDLYQNFEYKSDQTLSNAGISCKNSQTVLSHSDSHHWILKARDPVKEETSLVMEAHNIDLKPGSNDIRISLQVGEPGVYSLVQLSITFKNMDFLLPTIFPSCSFNVITEESSISLESNPGNLLSGIDQDISLLFKSGSCKLEEGHVLSLKSSSGLLVKDEINSSYSNQLELKLPAMNAFQTHKLPFTICGVLKSGKDQTNMEHRITALCPELISQAYSIQLSFSLPFHASFKCHSAYCRKFIQVQVHGLAKPSFTLKDHKLVTEDKDSINTLTALNPDHQRLEISSNKFVSYIWELDSEGTKPVGSLKFNFSTIYQLNDQENDWRPFSFDFKLTDYKTVYIIRSRVEPAKTTEFCRVNSMCQMHIHIQRIEKDSLDSSLMYEVITDQNMWTVCGKTSGVLGIGSCSRYDITLDVLPLIGGFLPLPIVRLSRYLPSETNKAHGTPTKDSHRNSTDSSTAARLAPFSPGQVFNSSRGVQVHVLPATTSTNSDS